jgi:hypothetical protein
VNHYSVIAITSVDHERIVVGLLKNIGHFRGIDDGSDQLVTTTVDRTENIMSRVMCAGGVLEPALSWSSFNPTV